MIVFSRLFVITAIRTNRGYIFEDKIIDSKELSSNSN